MPSPKAREEKKDFMKRCVPQLIHEGREQKQSVAICYSIWDRENKIGDTSEKEYRKKKLRMMNLHY